LFTGTLVDIQHWSVGYKFYFLPYITLYFIFQALQIFSQAIFGFDA
jgi:hypothetical protein